jgi:hypothetical protein
LKSYTVVTTEGEFIAVITREQRNRLVGCTDEGRAPRKDSNGNGVYNPRLITVHKKRDSLYYALVAPSVIRAEINREISTAAPVAEDNQTYRKDFYSTDKKSGWYWELHETHCFAFPTTESSARERSARMHLRAARRSHGGLTAQPSGRDIAASFPLKSNLVVMPKRSKKSNVIPFPSPIRHAPEPLPDAA